MQDAVIAGVNLDDASFERVDLSETLRAPPPIVYVDDRPLGDLIGEHERYCKSSGADGAAMKVSRVDFRPLRQLRRRMLTGMAAPRSVFFGLDMEGAQLQGCDLTGADLRGVSLKDADLRGTKLVGAKLNKADLRGARLGPLMIAEGRHIRTDLTRAILRGADLRDCHARRARFLEADLHGVRFDGADLVGAELET